MRKFGYYPALFVLLIVCLCGVGFFVYGSSEVMKRMGKYKSSDEAYQQKEREMQDAQTQLDNNQRTDKTYTDYIGRWISKEGQLDEAKLKMKLQKMAEDLGVTVMEVSALGAPDALGGAKNAKAAMATGNVRERGMLKPGAAVPVAMATRRTKSPDMIELKFSLSGPFGALMSWMARAEGELGSLRIVETHWNARSPEEVRLSVGVRYKTIGQPKNNLAPIVPAGVGAGMPDNPAMLGLEQKQEAKR